MKSKIWKTVELSTEFDQDIKVAPTPEFDGIELSYKETGDSGYPTHLYLDKKTMESLIATLQEMMSYVEKQ